MSLSQHFDSRDCPSEHDLRDFLAGKDDPAKAIRIERHFLQCERCLNRSAQLSLCDSVGMRASTTGQFAPTDGEINQLIQNLKAEVNEQDSSTFIEDASGSRQTVLGSPPDGYELINEIGRGGMGVVYRAKQLRLKRDVALKIVLGGLHVSAEALARFRFEGESIAKLRHANIVQVYETGEHEGVPYLALEFVGGGTLRDRLSGIPLANRDAATVVMKLAEAVAYAHQQGIVHRDLKPSNVLLAVPTQETQKDAERSDEKKSSRGSSWFTSGSGRDPSGFGDVEPKIADFGLAKHLEDDSEFTRTGQVIGTPSYMAPEQARGETASANPSVDIYALGTILYETLTGRPPFRAAKSVQTIRQVLSQEPVPPTQLREDVPIDLETICLKCLSKEPAGRYATALALASDLRSFLRGEPIKARPVNGLARAYRWAKRKPKAAVTIAAFATLMTLVTIASTVMARRFSELAAEKNEESIAATAATKRANQETERANALAEDARSQLYASQMFVGSLLSQKPAGTSRMKEIVESWHPSNQGADLRGWEWYYLKGLYSGEDQSLPTFNGRSHCEWTDWSRDESDVYVIESNSGISVHDIDEGTRKLVPVAGDNNSVSSAALNPNRDRVVIGFSNGVVRIHDTEDFKLVHEFDSLGDAVTRCIWSDDDKWILAHCTSSGHLRVWDTNQRELVYQNKVFPFSHLALHPNKPQLSLCSKRSAVKVIDFLDDQSEMEVGTPQLAAKCEWSPDGSRLAKFETDGLVGSFECIDYPSKKVLVDVGVNEFWAESIAWSPDQSRIAAAGRHGDVVVVDAQTGRVTHQFRAHAHRALCVAWNRDGTRLVTSGVDEQAKLWVLDDAAVVSEVDTNGESVVACHPIESIVAVATPTGVDLWNSSFGQTSSHPLASIAGLAAVRALAFQPTTKRCAVQLASGEVALVDFDDPKEKRFLVTKEQAKPIDNFGGINMLSWDDEGRKLACFNGTQQICIVDVLTGDRSMSPTLGGQLLTCDLSPDGTRVLIGTTLGIFLWQHSNDKLVTVGQNETYAFAVAWNAQGTQFAARTFSDSVRIYNAKTLEVVMGLRGPSSTIMSLGWSPDGRRLAGGSESGEVHLWDTKTGRSLAQFEQLEGYCFGVYWSADNLRLHTTSSALVRTRNAPPIESADRTTP